VSDVDQAAFRRAAGQFPGGIVVVTTSAGHAMTVSAFASVSLEPPLVLFCAEKIARFHDAVLAAGAWAVSILAEDGEKTARWLATRGRPLDGQLDELPHHPGPVTGAPLLDGALATMECRTFAVYDGGDHSIIVGRVVAVDDPPGAEGPPGPSARGAAPGPPARGAAPGPPARGAAPGPPARSPLIHHAGRYRRLRPTED
jgi:flavin reductase (DIM6/NTAB) family NADH-FMN oxidoreductase RutF